MNDEEQIRRGSRSSFSAQVTLNPDAVQRSDRVSNAAHHPPSNADPAKTTELSETTTITTTTSMVGCQILKSPESVSGGSAFMPTRDAKFTASIPPAHDFVHSPTTSSAPECSTPKAAAAPNPIVDASDTVATISAVDGDTSIPESQEVFQVVVRFRPLNARERKELLSYFTSQNDSDSELEDERLCEAVDSLLQICSNKTFTFDKKAYTFDRVFDATTGQRQLYAEVGQGLVRRFVEQPHDLTFIAYGQTSSGKTWTIDGDFYESQNRVTENAGLLFQAIGDIFRLAVDKFRVELSFYEIYCEKIVDLLVDESSGAPPPQVQLFDDKRSGKIFMKNLEWRKVTSEADLYALLANARQRRHYSFTEMNSNSSRSHTIFDLRLTLRKSKTPEFKNFRVVDLAGSERASRTKATGTTFEEGKKINQSLMDLRSIISQLSRAKDGVLRASVNHRASKLTRILYPSLHGKSRVVIITCCSQSLDSRAETNGSLQFACYAKKISLKLDDIKTAVTVSNRASNEASMQRELQRLNDEAQMREQKIQMYEREMNELRDLIRTMCEKRGGGDGDGGDGDGDGSGHRNDRSASRLSDSTTQTEHPAATARTVDASGRVGGDGMRGTGQIGVGSEVGSGVGVAVENEHKFGLEGDGEVGVENVRNFGLEREQGALEMVAENGMVEIGREKEMLGIPHEKRTGGIGQSDGTLGIDRENGARGIELRDDTFRNGTLGQSGDVGDIEMRDAVNGTRKSGGDVGSPKLQQNVQLNAAVATTRETSTLTDSEDVAERELRRYAKLLEKEQLKTARYKSTILSQRKLLDQKIHDNELLDQELQMMRMVKELILQQF